MSRTYIFACELLCAELYMVCKQTLPWLWAWFRHHCTSCINNINRKHLDTAQHQHSTILHFALIQHGTLNTRYPRVHIICINYGETGHFAIGQKSSRWHSERSWSGSRCCRRPKRLKSCRNVGECWSGCRICIPHLFHHGIHLSRATFRWLHAIATLDVH